MPHSGWSPPEIATAHGLGPAAAGSAAAACYMATRGSFFEMEGEAFHSGWRVALHAIA